MGKRGPAPKGEYVGQTSVLSTRLTPELRKRLEEEVAKRPNNTISREVEKRLRASFVDDDKMIEAFGSRENYALMRVISMVLELWHNPADPLVDWRHDPTAYDQVCKKVEVVLRAMRPPGEAKQLVGLDKVLAEGTVFEHPARVLKQIQDAELAVPLTGTRKRQILSLIKDDLGKLVERPVIFEGTAEEIRVKADRLEKEGEAKLKPETKKDQR